MNKITSIIALLLISPCVYATGFDTNRTLNLYRAFLQDEQNITQMMSGFPSSDNGDVFSASTFIDFANTALDKMSLFNDLGYLYNSMTNTQDRVVVLDVITHERKFFVLNCATTIRAINQQIATTSSAGLVSAAEKLRGHVRAACHEIAQW